jgi:hypothetical protein
VEPRERLAVLVFGVPLGPAVDSTSDDATMHDTALYTLPCSVICVLRSGTALPSIRTADDRSVVGDLPASAARADEVLAIAGTEPSGA